MKTVPLNGRDVPAPFADVYDPLAPNEYRTLDESVAARGVADPVHTYDSPAHGLALLDGVNRCELGAKHGRPVPVVHIGAMSDDEAREFLHQKHLGRRNLTPERQREMRAARVERVAEKRGEGKSLRTIAAEEGVSVAQVQDDLKKSGVHPCTPESQTAASATDVAQPTASGVQGCTPETPKVKGKDGKTYPAKRKNRTSGGSSRTKGGGKKSKNAESSPSPESSPAAAADSPKAGESKPAEPPKPGNPRPAPCAVTAGTSKFYPTVVEVDGSEMVIDAYGQVVPAGTADAFCDPRPRAWYDDMTDIMARFNALCDDIDDAKRTATAYPWLDQSEYLNNRDKCRASLGKMSDQIADSLMHSVCRKCFGHPRTGSKPGERRLCTDCRATGAWPARVCNERPDLLPQPTRPGPANRPAPEEPPCKRSGRTN